MRTLARVDGRALLALFALAMAVRDVHLGDLFGTLGLFETALLAFGSASVLFAVAALANPVLRGALWAQRRGVLATNLTTGAAWLCYFGALRLVEPAVATLAFAGIAPLAVAFWHYIGLSAGVPAADIRSRGLRWAMLGCVLAAAGISLTSSIDAAEAMRRGGGVALALLAGAIISAETVFALQLNLAGLSSVAVLGTRFVAVSVLALLVVLAQPTRYAGMEVGAVALQGAVLLGIVVLPLLLAQEGLRRSSPEASGVILALSPALTLLLDALAHGRVPQGAMLVVVLMYAAIATAAAWVLHRSALTS